MGKKVIPIESRQYPASISGRNGRLAVAFSGNPNLRTQVDNNLGAEGYQDGDLVAVLVLEVRPRSGGGNTYRIRVTGHQGGLEAALARRAEDARRRKEWEDRIERDRAEAAAKERSANALKEEILRFAAGESIPRQVEITAGSREVERAMESIESAESRFDLRLYDPSLKGWDSPLLKGAVLVHDGRVLVFTPMIMDGELVLGVSNVTGCSVPRYGKIVAKCGTEVTTRQTVTITGDGRLELSPHEYQPVYAYNLKPHEASELMRRGATVERSYKHSTVTLELSWTVQVANQEVQAGGKIQIEAPTIGTVLEEKRHSTTRRVWRSEELSRDERILYPTGYEDATFTEVTQLVRFPSGQTAWWKEQGNAHISAAVFGGDLGAIEYAVTPVRIAGALPCSTRFDARVKAEREAAQAKAEAEKAKAEAEAERIHAEAWEALSAEVKESKWVDPEDFSTEELLKIAALDPERQLRVVYLNGKQRAKAMRREQDEQAEASSVKQVQGSFKANLGNRVSGIDLSLFGLD